MAEVVKDCIGNNKTRHRVLRIIKRKKQSFHYCEWNNKKMKHYVNNKQYIDKKTLKNK